MMRRRAIEILIALAVATLLASCAEPSLGLPSMDESAANAGKQPYKAPILSSSASDSTALPEGVSIETIQFGETKQGKLDNKTPFAAYIFDAYPGARISISVSAMDGNIDPVVAVYGPRTFQGLWGEAIASADDFEGVNDAVIVGLDIERSGQYLILVGSYDNLGSGRFGIGLGCSGMCAEPPCEDEVCNLFCEDGFLVDPNGCPACACIDGGSPSCECSRDSDCPNGLVCDGCSCVDASDCQCAYEWAPVCGEDGNTYPNRCEAECNNVEVAYEGECIATGAACASDADCAQGEVCVDGTCQVSNVNGQCNCPENWAPVCGKDGNTYPNRCEAECNDVEVAYDGECTTANDLCIPICMSEGSMFDSLDEDGNDLDDSDEENAEGWYDSCTGEFLKSAECETCVDDPESDEDLCSPCEAICGGAGTPAEGWYDSCTGYLIQQANCSNDANYCSCPPVYDPVCGSDRNAYTNPCLAECNGVNVIHSGPCREEDSGCTSPLDCPYGFACVPAEDSYNGVLNVCKNMEDAKCHSNDDCPDGFRCVNFYMNPVDDGLCLPETRDCIRTGCNHEICAPMPVSTNCDNWQPKFVCLNQAICERQPDGSCGWTETPEFAQCVQNISNSGSCQTDSDCEDGAVCIDGICSGSDCMCPDTGRPVCGTDCTTYTNVCHMLCNGASLLHAGRCTGRESCNNP